MKFSRFWKNFFSLAIKILKFNCKFKNQGLFKMIFCDIEKIIKQVKKLFTDLTKCQICHKPVLKTPKHTLNKLMIHRNFKFMTNCLTQNTDGFGTLHTNFPGPPIEPWSDLLSSRTQRRKSVGFLQHFDIHIGSNCQFILDICHTFWWIISRHTKCHTLYAHVVHTLSNSADVDRLKTKRIFS